VGKKLLLVRGAAFVNFKGIKLVTSKSHEKHSKEYGKTRETFPLEGGRKRMGVKGLTRDALLTPHPDPLPQGERGDNF
jgi:hypothetical protein